MKDDEMQKSANGIPLVREWAEAQYQAALKERNELGPIVKHNKKLALISGALGYLVWFASLPLPHPQSLVLMATGLIFFAMALIISFRNAPKSARYEVAKWQMEIMSIGLRLGIAIGAQNLAEYVEEEKQK